MTKRVISLIILALIVLPSLWCCVIPLFTGQVCIDFLSGHVPIRAQERFLERIFEATVAKEFDWLKTVSSADGLKQLREIQTSVTPDYNIIWRDNLMGSYEYRIRFDNGATVYMTLFGEWPSCPDLYVTEDEIFKNMRLGSIELE